MRLGRRVVLLPGSPCTIQHYYAQNQRSEEPDARNRQSFCKTRDDGCVSIKSLPGDVDISWWFVAHHRNDDKRQNRSKQNPDKNHRYDE